MLQGLRALEAGVAWGAGELAGLGTGGSWELGGEWSEPATASEASSAKASEASSAASGELGELGGSWGELGCSGEGGAQGLAAGGCESWLLGCCCAA